MSMFNLSAVLVEQSHVAGEITITLRTASPAAVCPCCFCVHCVQTDLCGRIQCGKKVVQSRKWECTMPVDEMFDILPQDAAWGHEMAHDADGLELHYVRRG